MDNFTNMADVYNPYFQVYWFHFKGAVNFPMNRKIKVQYNIWGGDKKCWHERGIYLSWELEDLYKFFFLNF